MSRKKILGVAVLIALAAAAVGVPSFADEHEEEQREREMHERQMHEREMHEQHERDMREHREREMGEMRERVADMVRHIVREERERADREPERPLERPVRVSFRMAGAEGDGAREFSIVAATSRFHFDTHHNDDGKHLEIEINAGLHTDEDGGPMLMTYQIHIANERDGQGGHVNLRSSVRLRVGEKVKIAAFNGGALEVQLSPM